MSADSVQVKKPLSAMAGRPVDVMKDDAIFAAARSLLFEQGPQAVTMEGVAKRAAVSKVTVYARHKNRDELLMMVIQSELDGFTQHITGVQTTIAEVRQAMINFSINVLNFQVSQEYLQLMRAISAATNVSDQVLQDFYNLGPQKMQEQLAQWMAALHKAQLIDCPLPMMSAETFAGMLQRLEIIRALYRVKVEYSAAELEAQAIFIVDAFLKMHQRG